MFLEKRLRWRDFHRDFDKLYRPLLPKRYCKPHTRRKLLTTLKGYYGALCDGRSSPFKAVKRPRFGWGIVARREITRPGVFPLFLFGHLRRCPEKKLIQIEKVCKETSIVKVPLASENRSQWFIMDGPAALLNHSCKAFNAEWRFDQRSTGSAFQVEVLRKVKAGEEITVHYGDAFWEWVEKNFGTECQCESCSEL